MELRRTSWSWNPVEWAGGPTPPPYRTGPEDPLVGPGDTAADVYAWFVRQAAIRLGDVKSHILTGSPTVSELEYRYTVDPKGSKRQGVQGWISKTIERAAKIAGTKKGARFRAAVQDLEARVPKPFTRSELRIPEGVIFFASGAQGSPGDMEGITRVASQHPGVGVGVTASGCGAPCVAALRAVKRRRVPLFVDSGAYSEFTTGIEITDEEWRDRLALYRDLGAAFGDRANLVAPDKIGSQRETAARLRAYGGLLAAPARARAWILLAAQAGERPRHAFWEDMRGALAGQGVPEARIVAALPLKKQAMSLGEVEEFARHFGRRVSRYHLLGVGPKNRSPGFRNALEAIWRHSPLATITCDASTIVAGLRGAGELLGVVPGVYTYAQDIVRYELMLEAFQRSWRSRGETMEGWLGSSWGQKHVPEYHDEMLLGVDEWLPRRYRRVLADRLVRRARAGERSFTERDYKQLVERPQDFLASGWWEDPEISFWVDEQWTRYMGTVFTARVKRDALELAWKAVNELAFGRS